MTENTKIPPFLGVEKMDSQDWRHKPFIVPWTNADYVAVRYLAGSMNGSLADIGRQALLRGLREMVKEEIAARNKRGKFIPQRLAALAYYAVDAKNTPVF